MFLAIDFTFCQLCMNVIYYVTSDNRGNARGKADTKRVFLSSSNCEILLNLY